MNTRRLTSPPEAHFGGPDQPDGILRDMLEGRIEAVPANGSIDWVTYYFRDRRLALALLRAHRRGVHVKVALSRHTRTAQANADVIAILAGGGGLGDGLRLISLPGLPMPVGRGLWSRLHEKLYLFSHPEPIAFIGSFNPSGDVPELRPDIVAEIGEHDSGWNALVGITDPTLVCGLLAHARHMHARTPGLFYRFGAESKGVLEANGTGICFWPRLGTHPVLRRLEALSPKAHVRIAASHLSARSAIEAMLRLARRGVRLEILTEPTLRRVTLSAEQRLREAGICFTRLVGADVVPMHLKFVLAHDDATQWTAFGSFNWTLSSMYLNHEIAVISTDRQLFDIFAGRWAALDRARTAQLSNR